MLAYLDPNIHGTLKPRRGRPLSPPVETFTRATIRHKKPSSPTLSVTIISFGLPSAYGERMVKYNKLLCARETINLLNYALNYHSSITHVNGIFGSLIRDYQTAFPKKTRFVSSKLNLGSSCHSGNFLQLFLVHFNDFTCGRSIFGSFVNPVISSKPWKTNSKSASLANRIHGTRMNWTQRHFSTKNLYHDDRFKPNICLQALNLLVDVYGRRCVSPASEEVSPNLRL